MCGIIGIANNKEASKLAFLGLYSLQHRGEEAAGIASYDGREIYLKKNLGLVADALSTKEVEKLVGFNAIGHCRYSTTGSSNIKNVQPFVVKHRGKAIALAHNGNLTNTAQLHHDLEQQGSIFQTTMDSEIIVHLLAHTQNGNLKDWFLRVLSKLEGAFSLVFLVEDCVVGARDSNGFRPMCLGQIGESYVLASESCALDLIRAKFIREIMPGEIIFIKGKKIESVFLPKKDKSRISQCIFENVYFARPDSNIFDDNVYQVRVRLGRQLAKEHPVKADFVMPIPDSGNYAALGYAKELNMSFESGIVRNHYIGRTFIQPTQFIRDFRVSIKLNPIRKLIEGKKIVVVEDSIVRGTTSRSRIEEIRRAGAKEIHMRISCPPIISPCFYGIDFPSKKELIAAKRSAKQIADFIKVDSLAYLSLDGMLNVMKHPKEFCHACYSGKYPVAIPKNKSKYLLEGAK